MRIVVTGKDGQVARALIAAGTRSDATEIIAVGRPELDLARPETIAPAIAAARPDVVVSAAAYTAVDQAEDEPDQAFLINEKGAGEVARAARELGVPIIHLSTDYVFSGDGAEPYDEAMATGPKGVYGASKLAGEQAVAAANANHLILRVAWVYSPYGKNFVKTMLRLAEGRDQLSVVDDQIGNPTSAEDIADAVLAISRHWQKAGAARPNGLYHFVGSGETSWCGFAREIFRVSGTLSGPTAEVAAITTAEFPTKAARPKNSRLDCRRFATDFGHAAPPWQESTARVVNTLLRDRDGSPS
ncbi:dTDP-4-dehydrorhamnose reductase [Afifella aestuarii]|uniref:dTDP-4-dehydrorhamnose reductase n=1 Tax=Afifella aestuarii TaxID=1909496 RepID=UPI000FE2B2EE|nr:dTDP-4-dehydrorhamnose reductase [Afifella aestuarii]